MECFLPLLLQISFLPSLSSPQCSYWSHKSFTLPPLLFIFSFWSSDWKISDDLCWSKSLGELCFSGEQISAVLFFFMCSISLLHFHFIDASFSWTYEAPLSCFQKILCSRDTLHFLWIPFLEIYFVPLCEPCFLLLFVFRDFVLGSRDLKKLSLLPVLRG